MDINISDEVQKLATKCPKDFCCLKKDHKDSCAVLDCVNKEVIFVKASDRKACPYKHSFANEFICGCPVRKEIFNKYNV